MINIALKKIKVILNKFKMQNIDWKKQLVRILLHIDWRRRLIGILLLFLYLVGILIFGKEDSYITSSKRDKSIRYDTRTESKYNKI